MVSAPSPFALALAAIVIVASSGASADPPPRCPDVCDRKAAACVDACEESAPDDPMKRVKCKLACADTRNACVKACPAAPPPS